MVASVICTVVGAPQEAQQQGPNGTPRGPRLSLPEIGNTSSSCSTEPSTLDLAVRLTVVSDSLTVFRRSRYEWHDEQGCVDDRAVAG